MSEKRTFLALLVVFALFGALLAACAPAAAPTEAPAAPTEAAAPEATKAPEPTAVPEPTEPPPMPGADKQGGTLVLGFYQEPELLNSLIRTQTVASWAGDFMERGPL